MTGAPPGAVEVDLYDRDQYVEGVPHESFARLRREAPAHWNPEPDGPGFWSFTRYQDVVEVNRDWDRFSSHRGATLIDDTPPETLEAVQQMMLNLDPPLHTRYRLLVNKGFTPRTVRRLEESMRRQTRAIVDRISERGECDFVTDVASELPLQVIADIMGVPQEDRHQIFDWSNRMVGAQDPEYAEGAEQAVEASMELYAYAHELAAERRASPRDDVVSVLLGAEVDGHKLTETQFDMFFLLLAVAGNETTRNAISNGLLALMDHRDQWDALVAHRSLMDRAVEKMLRWATPVMHFRRTATRDTDVGGHPVTAGDKIVIWYMSANRDEAVFDEPDTFDIRRSPNEHVSFGGGGPHFCLGANLARLEMGMLFGELCERLPDLTLAGPPQRLRSNFINGVKHIPVAYTPPGRRG